ncbi:hypothetical protein JCM19235_2035 [Vibrio maritimus]|uniref:Uncharacterized protein n=1 Tax=Vibrio maritimus TaxID=990268 RepID=A0A090SGK8_9VIBR|nr:hypothetical protein JCM19235_2035 [Vibrio maritimus]
MSFILVFIVNLASDKLVVDIFGGTDFRDDVINGIGWNVAVRTLSLIPCALVKWIELDIPRKESALSDKISKTRC